MKKLFLYQLIRRAITSVVLLFLIVTLLFCLIQISPGSPAQKYLSPTLSVELNNKISESFKLESGGFAGYFSFIGNFLSGNLGVSYTYKIPVEKVIADYLPFTVLFAGLSILVQLICGFGIFYLTTKFTGRIFRKSISGAMLILYLVPSYLTGIFLIYLFSVKFNLLPSSGLKSFSGGSNGFIENLLDYLKHLILPLAAVSASGIPVFFKYIKDSYNDFINRKFVTGLKAQGFSEKRILLLHILPNIAGVLTSITAIELGTLLGGALLTEVIFGLPGMGRLTYSAVLARDYPLIIGCSFSAAVFVIISNFIADLIKSLINKRSITEGILN